MAVGLALAVLLAWVWVRVHRAPMTMHRDVGRADHVEGDDVDVDLQLEVHGPLVPSSLVLVEDVGRLGERSTRLLRHGRRLRSRYVLERLPRGRYAYGEVRALLEDPFGLELVEARLRGEGSLLVYPRLVEVERLFSEGGAGSHGGRRLLLRRASGFDLHSVREHIQGESLKKVHWPTTARTGKLMVKDFEDAPRDEVAVLLDAHRASVQGEPPDSSFDVQVRAAGSILQTHARRGRRAVLVVNSARREVQRVHSHGSDWRRALEVLAGAEATGVDPVAAVLGDESSPVARALELVVVTASLPAQLVDRLVQRALSHHRVSLVYVDSASFDGRGPRREPALLRLHAAGVPVSVVRRGDDLAARLSAAEEGLVVHG